MSFSSQPRALQRYSYETASQKQGKHVKQLVDDVQKFLRTIKSKKYTNSDFLILDNKLHEVKIGIRTLESINPNSQHESFEKKEFLQHFKRELGKIANIVQTLKQPAVEKNTIEKEIENEEQLKVEIYEDDLIEKTNILKEVQSNMHELNAMFKDLAGTVEDQGKIFDSVENFIEISEKSTKYAVEELDRASSYQKSQRCYALVLIPGVIVLVLVLIYFFS